MTNKKSSSKHQIQSPKTSWKSRLTNQRRHSKIQYDKSTICQIQFVAMNTASRCAIDFTQEIKTDWLMNTWDLKMLTIKTLHYLLESCNYHVVKLSRVHAIIIWWSCHVYIQLSYGEVVYFHAIPIGEFVPCTCIPKWWSWYLHTQFSFNRVITCTYSQLVELRRVHVTAFDRVDTCTHNFLW